MMSPSQATGTGGGLIRGGRARASPPNNIRLNRENGTLHSHKRPHVENYLDRVTHLQPPIDRPLRPHQNLMRYQRNESPDCYEVEDGANFSLFSNLVINESTSSLTNPSSMSNTPVNTDTRKANSSRNTKFSSPPVKEPLPPLTTTTTASSTSSRSCNAENRAAYSNSHPYHLTNNNTANSTKHANGRSSIFRSPSPYIPPTSDNNQRTSPVQREYRMSPTMSMNVTNGPSGGLQFIPSYHESLSESPIENASMSGKSSGSGAVKIPFSSRFASAALVSQYNNKQDTWEQCMNGTEKQIGSKAESTVSGGSGGWRMNRNALRSNSRPTSPMNPKRYAAPATNGGGVFASMNVDEAEDHEVGLILLDTSEPSRHNVTGGKLPLRGSSRGETKITRRGSGIGGSPSYSLINDTDGADTRLRNPGAVEEGMPDGYYEFGTQNSHDGSTAASNDNLHGSSSFLDDEATSMLSNNTKDSGKYNKSRAGPSGNFRRKIKKPEFSRLEESNLVANSSSKETRSSPSSALLTMTDVAEHTDDEKDNSAFLTNGGVKKGSGKVARLASLFSSRVPAKGASDVRPSSPTNVLRRPSASVKGTEEPSSIKQRRDDGKMPEVSFEEHCSASAPHERSTRAPSSPSKSSISHASSGYVDWPGTLDRTGGLVKMTPSFSGSESSSRRSLEKISGEAATKTAVREAADFGVADEYSELNKRDGTIADTKGRKSREWQNSRSVVLDRIQERAASQTSPAMNETRAEICRVSSHADFGNTSGSPTPLRSNTTYEPSTRKNQTFLLRPSSPRINNGRANLMNKRHQHSLPPPPSSPSLGSAHCVSPRHGTAVNIESKSKPSVFSPDSNGNSGQSGHSESSGGKTRRKSESGGKNGFGPISLLNNSPWESNDDINHIVRENLTSSQLFPADPWDVNSSSIHQPSRSTQTSRDDNLDQSKTPLIDTSGSVYRVRSAGMHLARDFYDKGLPSSPISSASLQTIRSKVSSLPPTSPTPLSEAALKLNDHLSPPTRNLNAMTVRGYRGFLEKTKDVPNLMDDESDSGTTATTSIFSGGGRVSHSGYDATHSKVRSHGDSESDVFDGLSSIVENSSVHRGKSSRNPSPLRASIVEEAAENKTKPDLGVSSSNMVNIVKVGSLTIIQATPEDFAKRSTSHEYDANLTESDTDLVSDDGTRSSQKSMISQVDNNIEERPMMANELDPRQTGNADVKDDHFKLQVLPPWPARCSDSTEMFPRSSQFANSDADLPVLFISQSGTNDSDDKEQLPLDLSCYYVQPHCARRLIRFFRKMCQLSEEQGIDCNSVEDAKKAFALFEMRSRIMETDIERGLERRGGSVPVDDLVLTPYNQAACRVRDAVIVSKAWRDGASPRDVITASLLTRRAFKTYCVKRYTRTCFRPGSVASSFSPGATGVYGGRRTTNNSADSTCSSGGVSSDNGRTGVHYTFEEVRWIDDTDFALLRCPSLGPRCLRGFEMFTIGDCQSLLLKLTNERCVQLRSELNAATARQLLAEELLKDEADFEQSPDNGDMTDAETTYLVAMEEVKNISKQLVLAEKAFLFIREGIERLVARYESILIKIDNDMSTMGSSDSTFSVDNDDESTYDSEEEDREKELLARRAQRAELRAEVAAREAALAKQEVEKTKKEAEKIQEEKQRQLDDLQRKFDDLESRSVSYVASNRYEQKFVNSLQRPAFVSNEGVEAEKPPSWDTSDAQSFLQSAASKKIHHAKVADIKAKFRSRRAEKASVNKEIEPNSDRLVSSGNKGDRLKNRVSGEEMHQHIDFYERSLKAVNNKH